MLQRLLVEVLRSAHVEVEHGVLHPFLLVVGYGQSLKKLLSSLEIGLKREAKSDLPNLRGRLRNTYFMPLVRKSAMYLVLST